MTWNEPTIAVVGIGVLHVFFMLGELIKWERPLVMDLVLKKWPQPLNLSPGQSHFVSNVVHNAGIYNGIVAGGLFASASLGPNAFPVQVALLTGGIVAGLFGAATLTRATVLQAIAGVVALVAVIGFR